jgi:phosphoglycolate phosphatase/pyrophosphatase PpaX
MIKAVFFDMDGTIGDTMPLCIGAFRKAIEPLAGRIISDEEITATFGPSEEGTISALIPDYYEQGLSDYQKHYDALHEQYPHPFDGITDIIKHLKNKGIIVGIVTGKGRQSADITLRRYGMDGLFDAIEAGSPNGPRKPEGLKALLKKFNLSADEAVYVGDAPSDITAASEAGMPIISAAWASTAETDVLKKMNPNATFESVESFEKYIKNAMI